MPPSNTQLLSLNLLALAGVKDIWQLPAEPLTPSSRSSSRASICRRNRAAFIYLVTVGPSVAENRMPDDSACALCRGSGCRNWSGHDFLSSRLWSMVLVSRSR